ncbi:MAG: MFS transporter [Alphaproteobacteria bacterium]
MAAPTSLRQRLVDAVAMFLVAAVSLMLLMYIGFGEGQRTYQHYYLDKLAAQARVLQTSLDGYLRRGLPLNQFVGFATKADPFTQTDPSIVAMTVYDPAGAIVFAAGTAPETTLLPPVAGGGADDYAVHGDGALLQVVLPLRTRFEEAGSLAVTMQRAAIDTRLQQGFGPLLWASLTLSAAFAAFAALGARRFAGARFPWLQLGLAAVFAAMAAAVIATLVGLYAEGTQAKARALADSLGERLSSLISFNLGLDEVQGLDGLFREYLQLNPDLGAVGIAIDGEPRVHEQDAADDDWLPWSGTYDYVVDLTDAGADHAISVLVSVPEGVVYRAVARSVKNFAALFVASALLSGVFMQLARSLRLPRRPGADGAAAQSPQGEAALDIVKPLFFLAVLAEHLTYAFLPQHFQRLVAEAGLPESLVSAPFLAFYLAFALTLVPAGHFAQQASPKPLIAWGLVLAAAGLALLAVPLDIAVMIAARALSGIGQGMLFIGVQAYILATAASGRKTQGAGIIVFGFQGGMIAGMAIGSLLVTYVGTQNVFLVAAGIAGLIAVYAFAVVPGCARARQRTATLAANLAEIGRNAVRVLRDPAFLKTILLIGMPAKAVLTGVVIFALPLLLSARGYPQEDIGQIIMVYGAGVIVASSLMTRVADRLGSTRGILFWGAAISGLGLALVGAVDRVTDLAGVPAGLAEAAVLLAGVALVGIAHGFINAPVVTHVTESALGHAVGASTVTASYRFLERAGHVAGPIIVGQLFIVAGQRAELIAWIGGAIALFAVLFVLRAAPRRTAGHGALVPTE